MKLRVPTNMRDGAEPFQPPRGAVIDVTPVAAGPVVEEGPEPVTDALEGNEDSAAAIEPDEEGEDVLSRT